MSLSTRYTAGPSSNRQTHVTKPLISPMLFFLYSTNSFCVATTFADALADVLRLTCAATKLRALAEVMAWPHVVSTYPLEFHTVSSRSTCFLSTARFFSNKTANLLLSSILSIRSGSNGRGTDKSFRLPRDHNITLQKPDLFSRNNVFSYACLYSAHSLKTSQCSPLSLVEAAFITLLNYLSKTVNMTTSRGCLFPPVCAGKAYPMILFLWSNCKTPMDKWDGYAS